MISEFGWAAYCGHSAPYHPPIDATRFFRDHACMQWNDQPGYKVEVPRYFLETLAEQMSEPEKWAYMLREHARTIRKQLEQANKARGKGRWPPP